jgi:putative hydrolase of the HAD superfamily
MTRPPRGALPSGVENVLFDAGGVLLEMDFAFLRRVIAPHGADIEESELSRVEARARFEINSARTAGQPLEGWRDFFYLVLGRAAVAPDEHDAIIETLWEAHHRVGLWTVATPQGPQTVLRLKEQGIRVAVVSNAEGQVARDLDAAGYTGMFETVIDSHVVGVRKPDPAIFGIALEKLKVKADRTAYVGDMPAIDVAGSRAAGLRPILLDRHDFYPDLDVHRIRSLEQL